KDLKAVNKELRESLDVFGNNKMLKAENISYQQQLGESVKTRADLDVTVKGLRDDLRAASEREENLRRQLKKYLGDGRKFKLVQNKAEILGEAHVQLTFKDSD